MSSSCESVGCSNELCSQRIITEGIPKNLMQIQANSYEMKQRISDLIANKRSMANKRNDLEFFNQDKERTSCARADAELKCKGGGKSHLEVCQVWNAWGPQTAVNTKSNPTKCSCPRCILPNVNIQASSSSLITTEGSNHHSSPRGSIKRSQPDQEMIFKLKKVYTVEDIDQQITVLKKKIMLKEDG